MLYKIQNFENKTPSDISFEEIEFACGEKIKVYDIETVHDLTQFIGFGKYMNNQNCNVFCEVRQICTMDILFHLCIEVVQNLRQ